MPHQNCNRIAAKQRGDGYALSSWEQSPSVSPPRIAGRLHPDLWCGVDNPPLRPDKAAEMVAWHHEGLVYPPSLGRAGGALCLTSK